VPPSSSTKSLSRETRNKTGKRPKDLHKMEKKKAITGGPEQQKEEFFSFRERRGKEGARCPPSTIRYLTGMGAIQRKEGGKKSRLDRGLGRNREAASPISLKSLRRLQ